MTISSTVGLKIGLKIGIVGTGEMGRPLVDRLLGAGFDVAAYVRRTDVRDELTRRGVDCVASVTALGASCDVVIVYVYSDEQVRQVVFDDGLGDALRPGSTLIVQSTASPKTMETIDAAVGPRGVGVLDAPGSGGPDQLRAAELTLLVGGAFEQVQRCAELFSVYANNVVHLGPVGAGQKVKLLNNLLFGAHVELAVEAARLCESFGLDPALVATTLRSCSGASYALGLIASMGSAAALLEKAAPFIHKDVLVAESAASDIDAALGTMGLLTGPVLDRTRSA
jgi:3-hydroxyisobutyrate dehydrogenase-like beta-hydroxyacid dehydrogenase